MKRTNVLFSRGWLTFVLMLTQLINVLGSDEVKESANLKHPYLFFSESDLPEVRDRITREPFQSRWNVFIQNADAVLASKPHVYESGRGDVGNSRKHLENAGKTSFAYIITGEKKYAERAIDEAMAMVSGVLPANDQMVWYEQSFRNWNKGADLNTAEISYGLAMVYDWCHDVLTDEQKEKIKNALINKGIKHYLNSIERDNQDFWVGNPVSNWAGVVNGGVGLGALAIYNESEDARKAVNYTKKYIAEFLDHVFLEDGGGHEGIMYSRYGQLFALYFKMAEQRVFGFDKKFVEKLNEKLAGYWDVYMYTPDYGTANFNNMGEGRSHRGNRTIPPTFAGTHSDIDALMENFSGGDSLLLWAADNGRPRFYWNGASPWFFLWRRGDTNKVSLDEKPKLQDAVLFRGAGHAIFQSDNLWMAYNAGWTSDKSHNNRDLGSFILVAGKERLVNDPGYGDGDAKYHSTIVINNEDQFNGKGAKYLNFGSGDSFHYLASDLTEVYNPDYLRKFIRQVLMVNDTYIVIVDELELKQSAKIEWRLQTRKDVEVLDGENAVINGEDYQLFVINAAEKMDTGITPWEGRNGKLNAISKKPLNSSDQHLFVTVLFPAKKDKFDLEDYPKANFKNGLLSVADGKGLNDKISFDKLQDRWILESVNDEKDLSISEHTNRTVKSYRKKTGKTVNIEQFPTWFLPIN